MLRSYIKIAFKVLMRRKFFTFVSLSGITITITILIIAGAFVDNMMRPARPGSKFERTMFVERIELKGEEGHLSSWMGYSFLDKYVKSMVTPEAVSIHRDETTTSVYQNDQRIDLHLKYTDAVFWDILEMNFLEGAPFGQKAVDNADYVMVISEPTRAELFGDEAALGKFIEITEGRFRVVGVIPKEEIPVQSISGDLYVPITVNQTSMNNSTPYGGCLALVLAVDQEQFEEIRTEFATKLDQARADYEAEWDTIICRISTQADVIIAYVFDDESESGTAAAVGVLFGAMLLFMLVPAINLINLNVTRVMERASEIGVRKAFGASSATLVGQFLTENLVLTLTGGALALVLSWTALWMITNTNLVPYGQFRPNLMFFGYCLLVCLIFGVVSGAYPAYKMSKMQPVDALRGVE
jgi:putative ABC transport system permease protein